MESTSSYEPPMLAEAGGFAAMTLGRSGASNDFANRDFNSNNPQKPARLPRADKN
ncbi:lasso RiPP family leader peptide-containing protein [Actinokineospora bangkokensis]|uniref:lasso RiPP family leader peptide-containing protein n=1 Tax=Actinokineospora bangkokensis TaxID=1193682 RepID=UPI000A82453E|nr:lasso RiPP family leader peptide-containing protein [Actinokineospora bangkokensis]